MTRTFTVQQHCDALRRVDLGACNFEFRTRCDFLAGRIRQDRDRWRVDSCWLPSAEFVSWTGALFYLKAGFAEGIRRGRANLADAVDVEGPHA